MESNLTLKLRSLTSVLFAGQGLIKHFAIIHKQKKVAEMIQDLKILRSQLDPINKLKTVTFLKRMRKICITLFITSNACVWILELVPILGILVEFMTKGEFTKTLPFGIWLPFDQEKYFFTTYCYQIYWGHLISAIPNIMDQLFFLILVDIISQFDCFEEQIEHVINNSANESFALTRDNLRKFIAKHIKLMSLVDDINAVYGIPLLAQIMAASGVIGLVGFSVTVRLTIVKHRKSLNEFCSYHFHKTT